MFWHLRMILAYKKTLGKFTKVLGFEKTPPPPLGKIPKKSRFFLAASLNTAYNMEFWPFSVQQALLVDNLSRYHQWCSFCFRNSSGRHLSFGQLQWPDQITCQADCLKDVFADDFPNDIRRSISEVWVGCSSVLPPSPMLPLLFFWFSGWSPQVKVFSLLQNVFVSNCKMCVVSNCKIFVSN